MATETTVQVIPSSADVPGLSVVTASRHELAPRSGLVYNPATLAAAVPLWFHPRPDGRYLALFSRRLTDAALSTANINGVLLYTGYEIDDEPCWATIGPRTGDVRPVELIPSEQPGIRRMVGAASRGNYLFVLNEYKKSLDDDETYSLLQNFRVTDLGVTLLGEETVPRDLRHGIFCDRRYLWLFGTDGDGKLALARKNWGRIGTDADANPVMNWQFWGKGSWNTDSDQLSAVIDEKGQPIPLDGPCSLARYRDTYYLMATTRVDKPTTGPFTNDRLSMALSPDGSTIYISDYRKNLISVVDLTTGKTTATIDTPRGPWSMGFDTAGSKLYVVCQFANTISVIDPAKNKITSEITVSKAPSSMVFHPNGTRLYLTNPTADLITVIDLTTRQVLETVSVGKEPTGISINPTGTRLYVTNKVGKTVSVINTATNKIVKNASVGYRNNPTLAAFKGSKVYIGGTDAILGLDTTVNRVLSSMPVRNIGLSLLAHPTANKLYLANTLDTISVINLDTNTVSNTIPVGTDLGAVQILLNANGSRLYATNAQDKTLSVIDTATNAVIAVFLITGEVEDSVTSQMNPIVAQLLALLYGVLNGFVAIGTGVSTMIANLFDQAVSLITGQSNATEAVVDLVEQFLSALTGTSFNITDPASILQSIISTITNIPVVGDVLELAQGFVEGAINAILNLATLVVGEEPVNTLEEIIRTITGILTGTANNGGEAADTVTIGTTQVSLTPEPSWQALAYASRKVQQNWSRHSFSYPIATTTTTYQDSGVCLQEQIPVTPGYGVTTTSSTVSILNETSDHTQVYTGLAPQTVILPPTAKVLGTTITTEGVIEVPDSPLDFNPTIAISDATITEGNFQPATVTFRASLSSSSTKTVSVKYATADQTAAAGSDYTALAGTLTFPPGIVSQQVSVVVSGDLNYEPDETFVVTLSEPVNATIEDATAICTIVNDDRQTLIESLLEDFKNIINGVASGAIALGGAIVTAVATILEQATRTLTGVVGDTGQLVLSLVDQFLNFISGGTLDLGEFDSPAELLASIFSRITGGTGAIASSVVALAQSFYTIATTTVTTVATGIVSVFQNLIGALFNPFGLLATEPMLMSIEPMLMLTTATTEEETEPVLYMPYTVHNQSTSDIVVMASDRDKTITVPKGTGMTFTPYVSEPVLAKDWSWTPSTDRAPRARQGYPYVSTNRLFVNTYLIDITGSPTSGVFRLAHDGYVSPTIALSPVQATLADNIRTAIAALKSINTFSVTPLSATSVKVVIIEDCSTLDVYSYRMFNGTSPKVEVSLDNSDSTLLTRWGIFQPEPKPAAPSGVSKEVTATVTDVPAELPSIIELFAKAITAVSEGAVAVGAGVIATVTDILGEAVYLITGTRIADVDGTINNQVTDFLQKLAIDDGVSDDAATSFENIIRQITGGTGLVGTTTVPTPMDFVSGAVNAVEDAIETLAETLLRIINAITGR